MAPALVAALRARLAPPARLLVVAADGDPFIAAAEAAGFTIAARLDMHEIERAGGSGSYEAAVVLFQLEAAPNPVTALAAIARAVPPGGAFLAAVAAPGAADAAGVQWRFDAQTIQSICLRAGFAELELTGATTVTGRRVPPRARPLLSIVMPVFNERNTFEQTLSAVRGKVCAGVDSEIIIVESRSSDGTRDLVRQYEDCPGITVVYEEQPRGKGHAVRTGLRRATGSIVLIQDADMEYDVNDYDELLDPIVTFRRAFVLGSRHIGTWKMRTFADQPAVSAFFNIGHVVFRTALNVMYGQSIRDPFTMYKVFRRDCLHGLKFECNRFDFDFELVIKLLRKGYVPLEVPVSYASRSFKEGKKVSAVRDPLTWIRALVKYRFASIYEDGR